MIAMTIQMRCFDERLLDAGNAGYVGKMAINQSLCKSWYHALSTLSNLTAAALVASCMLATGDPVSMFPN